MIRYNDNRITTTVTTTNYPVWKIPFPAVSICNSNLIYRSHAGKIIQILKNHEIPGDTIENYFQNLALTILNNELSGIDLDMTSLMNITHILQKEGYDTEKLMDLLAQPCSSMLRKCEWKAAEVHCDTLLERTKTTGGICCSFNYKGISTKDQSSSEETLAGGTGTLYGLKVYVDAEQVEYVPITQAPGFRVLVHNAYDYPDMWAYGGHLDLESKMSISIKPVILSSKEEIRGIDVKSRGCLFSDEKKLAWTNHYTINTCLKNCKLKVIWNMCRCIPFYFPISSNNFCTILDSSCVMAAERTYISSRIGNQGQDQRKGEFSCDCPSGCNEITYTPSVQTERLPTIDNPDSENSNLSVVSVYFGNDGILQFTRSEFISWDSLLVPEHVLQVRRRTKHVDTMLTSEEHINRRRSKEGKKENA
ncbi:hypothetical protein JTB14_016447 [Gonioctena quinquepunctata]|nr:hypothetical protein JTB14_016447 [Gonioctena quinquepunctata]